MASLRARSARLRSIAGAATLCVAGCGRLEQLPYEPLTTPEQWCKLRPCVEVGGLVLNEPLGSFLVFALAAFWIAGGVHFLKTAAGQRSRFWLGIALLAGGIGAAQAGISFQAFSYALKCAGREYCRLTNGFEVGYSLCQAFSVSAMLAAVAFASAAGGLRRALIGYAVVNVAAYLAVTAAGVALPSAALLSFEVLLLFAQPGIVLVGAAAARRYRQTRRALDRSLLTAALLLFAVQAAYYAYLAAGITQQLWDAGRGFYFSENDVLHAGMIGWVAYVVFVVGKRLRDADA